ncbi:SCF E3 ubiquitin ligase complex F-box protein grrA-like [Aphidius gifuensis]|uniref:SCF E3 ubiquitin ligase complex F-box protein grrA-like n=1 Tax=Aphidius gifuensis TaxID=684658 RepID=UPI001CDC3625|nr:SCF E3 ubiquitin ligase complex F-box protein grrA-like [Aphidius gifuensis]
MSAKRIFVKKDQQTSDDDDKDQKVVINSLDYDSLAQIFMLLPVPERIDIEGVCVKWKEACQLSWYNTKKYKCESSIGRSYDNSNTIVEYCKNLKHLSILNGHDIMNKTALKKLTELENLECLLLHNCMKLSEESIIEISNNCKKLKRLEISSRSFYNDPLSFPSDLDEISKLQYLEHLKLCIEKYLEDSTIIAIANNCKKLKSLEIRGSSAITETALVALTKLKNLQKLDVSFLDITDSFIDKLKGLKELHCDHCKKLTEAGVIQLIKNNPDLKDISVWGIDNITINLVIDADQVTKNRTNGIILHIRKFDSVLTQASKSIIKSQWLVVE